MPKTALRKEKWTLSFDARLKNFVVQEARREGVYPVGLLEQLVRERFSPYGLSEVRNSTEYVRTLRKKSRHQSDSAFLKELSKWHV